MWSSDSHSSSVSQILYSQSLIRTRTDFFFPSLSTEAVHFHQGAFPCQPQSKHRQKEMGRTVQDYECRPSPSAKCSQLSEIKTTTCRTSVLSCKWQNIKNKASNTRIPAIFLENEFQGSFLPGLISASSADDCWSSQQCQARCWHMGMGNKILAILNSVDCPVAITKCQS